MKAGAVRLGGGNHLGDPPFLEGVEWALVPWPDHVASKRDRPPQRVQGNTLRVSYVGHATVLIQVMQEIAILGEMLRYG